MKLTIGFFLNVKSSTFKFGIHYLLLAIMQQAKNTAFKTKG